MYGGHNEFYGVLGVASSQNLGKNRNSKLAYLQLKKFKTFLLLRNMLNGIRRSFVKLGSSESETEATATMMERLVGEQQILYDSYTYRAGKTQFNDNLDIILNKIRSRGIPVILSELVSNIKNQSPFISLTADQYPRASVVYEEGRKLEDDNQFDSARKKYYRAKDLDGLRFRASEDFNAVIHQLSKKYQVPVVAMKSAFEANSPNGLIGNHLMLDHLHPKIDGYFVMADAFYREIVKLSLIDEKVESDFPYRIFGDKKGAGYTELDSVYGELRIKILKGGWPFKEKTAPNKALDNFIPGSRAESLAVKIWTSSDYTLERGHVEMAEQFEKSGQYEKAYQEYLALIALTPYNVSPYLRAADTQLKLQALDNALPLLYHSLKIEQTAFALKWMGQILLERNQVNEALVYLELASKKLPADPQLLFNLAGAYALNQQYYKAKAAIDRLLTISPNFPDARNLGIQLDRIISQIDS
jgi:tetratricopeptide (TPR) repeat protein